MPMFANTTMNYRVIETLYPQAAALIKRWTLSNSCNWGSLIAHCCYSQL